MTIVKKCRACKQYFPAELQSFNCYCPKCYPTHHHLLLNRFKQDRNIAAEYFDMFDDQYPIEHWYHKFERVCRVCGVRLLTKKGNYWSQRRQCNQHTYFGGKYSWPLIRDHFISDFWKRHQTEICLRSLDENRSLRAVCYCNECHMLMGWGEIEVHHKIPIHTLTWENFMLIWDPENLEILCHTCHSKRDHQLKRVKKLVIMKPRKRTMLDQMLGVK